jgi:adenylate cyclase
LLTSKEVLERTGISRATLNNYISCGIVPRPEVLPPEPNDGAAPRIGYFPPETIARIEEIQRLKREGWSITRITEHFTGTAVPAPEGAVAGTAGVPEIPAVARGAGGATPSLSFGEIDHPAYLVNSRFEVVWLNDAAGSAAWPNFVPLPPEAVSRGIFQYLLKGQSQGLAVAAESRKAILRLHLGLARQHGASLFNLCREVPQGEMPLMERLYGEVEAFEFPIVVRTPVVANRPGPASPLFLYALNFREGILFIYVPGGAGLLEVSTLLARPEQAGANAAYRQAPALTQVAVLVTELQDAARLWSELPPEEYFELINEIWLTVDPIFKRYRGTNGKHPGEGMVGYFLPRPDSSYLWNALLAAQQVREAMRRVSKQWQLRKGWTVELYMNTGIDEGQEWHGTLRPGSQEFTVLGDAVDRAARISNFSRHGAIWVTRNLVGKLRADERRRLRYGVRRLDKEGRDARVASTFSRVGNLADMTDAGSDGLKAIARVPITEIFDVAAQASGEPDRAAGPLPV